MSENLKFCTLRTSYKQVISEDFIDYVKYLCKILEYDIVFFFLFLFSQS